MTLLWLLLLLHAVFARNITEQENVALKEKCKLVESPRIEEQRRSRSIDSRLKEDSSSELVRIRGAVEVSKYSFAVALSSISYIPDQDTGRTLEQHSKPFCSGVLISARHILTASHCLYDDNYNYSCSHGLRPSVTPAEKIGVFLESNCTNEECWKSDRRIFNISSTLVHPNSFKPVPHRDLTETEDPNIACPPDYDIALIELNSDVHADPVCMPEANSVILGPENIESIGYGDVDGSRIQSVKYQFVKEYGKIIFAFNTTNAVTDTFGGDSGGPFVQNLEGKRYLFGITHGNGTVLYHGEENVVAGEGFIDVRKHLQWICRETGVCPLSETTNQQLKPAPPPPHSDSPNEVALE